MEAAVLIPKHAQMVADSDKPVELSVVIPISERHDDLRELYHQYATELSATGVAYEFIFVLDGPDRDAVETLQTLKKKCAAITVLKLSRWFGEATALSVGFEKARGEIIVTLPPYLQVKPGEAHKLLNKLINERVDVVTAWRHPRIDSLFNQVQSRLFHRLIQIVTGMKYHDISCGMRIMNRKVAEEVQLYGDLHRFFPLLAHQRGFKVAEVPVQQSPHDAKRRLYTPGVYLRRLLDILTLFFLYKFTKKPLRFFGLIGSGIFGAGMIITVQIGVERLLGISAAGRPLLILGVLLMVFGIQLFSTGLLGEIIIFTHAHEVKEYHVEEILE